MATIAANSMEGRAKTFLERIERVYDLMATDKSQYMAKCKENREDIKEILIEAKDKGVPPKALRSIIKIRELARKQQAVRDGVEDIDEAAALDLMIDAFTDLGHALKGTPMGEYAERQVADLKGNGDDVRPSFLQQKDVDRALDESMK